MASGPLVDGVCRSRRLLWVWFEGGWPGSGGGAPAPGSPAGSPG